MVDRRVTSRSLLVMAAGALLAGCAVTPPLAWRVEGNTRIAHGSVDSAATGYLALARRYDGEHREALAAEAYRKAVREAPASADVLNASALGVAAHGDLATAIAWLQRAAELRPDLAPIANNLGYALMLAGRDAEAADALRRALAAAPTYRAAQLNLEQLDQRQQAGRAGGLAEHTAAPRDEAAAGLPTAMQTAASNPVRLTANVDALVVRFAGAANERSVQASPSVPIVAALAAPSAPTVRVDVVNGNGVNGLAARWRHWLRTQGVPTGRLANLLPYDTATTVVQYRPGFHTDAQAIAARLQPGVPTAVAPGLPLSGPVRIVIGHNSANADPG